METMKIVLEHETYGHDHGIQVEVKPLSVFCEGMKDGNKEYLKTETGIFERYTCYAIFSPYGWKKSTKTWEEITNENA